MTQACVSEKVCICIDLYEALSLPPLFHASLDDGAARNELDKEKKRGG